MLIINEKRPSRWNRAQHTERERESERERVEKRRQPTDELQTVTWWGVVAFASGGHGKCMAAAAAARESGLNVTHNSRVPRLLELESSLCARGV